MNMQIRGSEYANPRACSIDVCTRVGRDGLLIRRDSRHVVPTSRHEQYRTVTK